MTDQQPSHLDADEQFARELEMEHQRLVAGDETATKDGRETVNEPRVSSAVRVLELLEQIKPTSNAGPELARDTIDGQAGRETPKIGGANDVAAARQPTTWEFEQLGRFQIREQIGRGGYGIVLRAYDPDLNRDVAIKIPRIETTLSTDSRMRFERERRAAAGLNHPGIVTVFETGSVNGIDYIVSEFIDGENLDTLLARGRQFTSRQAADLVSRIADATEHAHQRGVLHRDLKPANVIMDRRENESPKITDFGLAMIADQQDFTQTGAVVGTPAYMSPEQATGNKRQIGPATDVYGLGALLYRLLAGQTPFEDLTILEMVRAIAERDPDPPRAINPDIPKDLEAICLKCLEKNPGKRYSSPQELQADLQRYLNGQQVIARRITGLDRLARWAKRNRAVAALSLALLTGLVTGLIIVSVLWMGSERNRVLAETNEARYLQKSEQLSTAIERLFTTLATSPEIRAESADGLRRTLLSEVNRFQAEFLAESPDDPELKLDYARSLKSLAEINLALGSVQNAQDLIRLALQQIQDIQGQLTLGTNELVSWWTMLGRTQVLKGDFEESQATFDRATNLLDEELSADLTAVLPDQLSQRAILATQQAFALIFADEMENAFSSAKMANEFWEALEHVDDRISVPTNRFEFDRAESGLAYAECLRLNGQLAEAETIYQKALAGFESTNGIWSDSLGLAYQWGQCLRGLGIAQAKQGKTDLAKPNYRKALAVMDPVAIDHPLLERFAGTVAQIRYSLAVSELVDGNLADALVLIERNIAEKQRLIENFPELGAKYHTRLGDARNILFVIIDNSSEGVDDRSEQVLLDAIGSFDRALEILPDWNRPTMALSRAESNLASVYVRLDRDADAREWFGQAHNRVEKLVAVQPDWNEAATAYTSTTFSLISFHISQEEFAAAVDLVDELVERAPNHPRTKVALSGKPKLLAQDGRWPEARLALEDFVETRADKTGDYLKAAEQAIQIAQLPSLSKDPEVVQSFVDQAIRIMEAGKPADDDALAQYLNQIQNSESLADYLDLVR